MLDRYLIEHCSPTLASLKTASLFTYRFEDDLDSTVAAWNAQFAVKGISLLVLRRRENTALIYVCRHKKLAADLKRPGVDALLRENGYTELSVSGRWSICALGWRKMRRFLMRSAYFSGIRWRM